MLDFIIRKQEEREKIKQAYTCIHSKTHLTKYTCSNGAIQFVMQCDECHARIGGPIKHKILTWKQRQEAPPFDSNARSEHREEISHQYAMAREKFNSAAWWREYNLYLSSDTWKSKRSRVLIRDSYKCTERRSGCTKYATEVHHLSYKNVGNEPLEDLISVCHQCHEKITADSRREWRTL